MKLKQKYLSGIISFIAGALVMSAFSTFQKIIAEYPIKLSGYYIPVFLGGVTGLIVGMVLVKLSERQAKLKRIVTFLKEKNFNRLNIFNHMRDSVFIHPLNLSELEKFIDVNDAACEKFGYSREEFMKMSVIDIAFQEDVMADVVRAHHEKVLSQGFELFEIQLIKKFGESFYAEVNSSKYMLDGKPFMISIVRDISLKKQIQQKYDELVNNIPDMIFEMSVPDGRYLFVNDAVKEVTGYDRMSILKNPFFIRDVIHPDFKKYFKNQWKLILAGHPPDKFLYKILDPDKNERWIEQRNYFKRNPKGVVISLEGIASDVTAKIKADESLKALSSSFANKSGKVYYEEISKHICQTLALDVVFIGRVTQDFKGIAILGGFGNNEYLAPFEYNLEATPCENVIGNKLCIYPNNLAQTFPLDEKIKKLNVQGYIGAPLFDKNQYPIGILVGMKKTAIKDQDYLMSQFGIYVERTAAEIMRSEMEQEIAKREKEYRLLVNNQLDLVVQIDTEGRFLFVSKNYCMMFGKTEEELLGNKFIFLVHEDDREKTLKEMEKLYIPPHKCYLVQRANTIHGWRWLAWSDNAVLNNAGEVISIIGSGRDITAQKNAELALQESEKKFRSVFEHSNVGMVISGIDGKIIEANERFQKFLGYSQKELNNQSINNFSHPEDIKKETLLVKEIIENRRNNFYLEKRYVNKSGDFIWADIFVTAQRGKNDTIVRLIGIIIDINEKKEAIDSFLASQKRFITLLKNMKLIAIALDGNGIITFCNRFLLELTGYEEREVIGKSWFDLFIPEDIKFHMEKEIFIGVLRSKKAPTYYENPIVSKTGEILDILWNNTLFTDKNGNFESVVSIGQDITERNKILKQIRESEAKFKSYMENAPIGILVANDKSEYVDVNPTVANLLGYSCEELLKMCVNDIIWPDDREKGRMHFQEVRKKGKAYGEMAHLCKNGQKLIVAVHAVKISDTRFMAFLIDLTEKKQAEEEKEKMEQILHRSQRLETLGTLAGGIAHDFNNLLTPIIGYSEMLRNTLSADDPIYENISEIFQAGNYAKELVSQMLSFSRDSDKNQKTVYVHKILQDAVKMLRPMIPSTVKIVQEIENFTEQIMADETRIYQVFVNIINNAYQSMEDKGGLLTIKAERKYISQEDSKNFMTIKSGDYLVVSIGDTGTGMDEYTIERIFDPFFTTKEVGKGTGLGLSVAHGVIQDHNGEITVISELGVGTTFYIYLPIAVSKADNEIENLLTIQGNLENILLVDDEVAVSKTISKLLDMLGYNTILADNSPEALKIFHENQDKIDLVITDLTMPEMTGLAFARKIHEINENIPIVMMTGYGNKISKADQETAGITAVMTKPIMVNEISEILDEIFH
ncbi:MAG: PAS domain S-box protein [Candidatus Marinimicrobia bacterium]|nr:PAS domain S-box protein [Candidatus Neomarinimicrobiota bacterium]